ncbi:MAG: hypothetical protein CL881_06275 [Dehalococcoidia bacterium]|jgi:hypothetical protein|nr:hypothetical protein [Dehalococcoidia bacterium]|tara:strand:- start:3083 stop:3343 length:261 start_codon:yes stop_codon:yes gene_type:complete
MSTQPDENEIEIEEGEIVTDDELSATDEEPNEEFEDDGSVDIAELMTSLMATDDGDTVCSALVNIANQLQTQNRILIKILSKMNSA